MESVKDQFYYVLHSTIVLNSKQLRICGKWNGHIGSHSIDFDGQTLEDRIPEKERLLKFAFSNSWFKKRCEPLITYQMIKTQTD